MSNEIKQISEIDFLDNKVLVFFDPTKDKNDAVCIWKDRNPDSYYKGVMYMNNETEKITYPDDAIIPDQTPRDREKIPKVFIIGVETIDNDLLLKMNLYLKKDHKRRNPSLYDN